MTSDKAKGKANAAPAKKSASAKTAKPAKTAAHAKTAAPAKKAAPAKPAAPAPSGGLAAGEAAPPFSLARDGGGTLSLADLKGKIVALYFYPKDDTSGCTREAIDFNGLKAAFASIGAVVVGMSPDPVKAHDKFRTKHDLAFPLVSDESKETLSAYGVWVEKSMYGRKYMGVERSTFLIDRDGTIARVWRKVSVPGHAEEVLEAAKAL